MRQIVDIIQGHTKRIGNIRIATTFPLINLESLDKILSTLKSHPRTTLFKILRNFRPTNPKILNLGTGQTCTNTNTFILGRSKSFETRCLLISQFLLRTEVARTNIVQSDIRSLTINTCTNRLKIQLGCLKGILTKILGEVQIKLRLCILDCLTCSAGRTLKHLLTFVGNISVNSTNLCLGHLEIHSRGDTLTQIGIRIEINTRSLILRRSIGGIRYVTVTVDKVRIEASINKTLHLGCRTIIGGLLTPGLHIEIILVFSQLFLFLIRKTLTKQGTSRIYSRNCRTNTNKSTSRQWIGH